MTSKSQNNNQSNMSYKKAKQSKVTTTTTNTALLSSSQHSHASHTSASGVSGNNVIVTTPCSVEWSGFETLGMRRAKCSLLLQDEMMHDVAIKKLNKQRVFIDRSSNVITSNSNRSISSSTSSSTDPVSISSPRNINDQTNETVVESSSYYVDFDGATILQFEPTISSIEPPNVMPITMTVAGKCVFTPENYLDFKVMMRTKEQSCDMNMECNGSYDWPDVTSFLLCPVCGNICSIPRPGDRQDHEYWMVFYPLLQITNRTGCGGGTSLTNRTITSSNNNNEMTISTRTICRLTCLDCMDDMLEGLSLNVVPGGLSKERSVSSSTISRASSVSSNEESVASHISIATTSTTKGLAFSLPAADILAEAGSVSFLEGGPPRPDTHQHLDDILDAWTLYTLWECSGAWEALQNDYKMQLSKSLSLEPIDSLCTTQASWTKRVGQKCGSSSCSRVDGMSLSYDSLDANGTGEICRLCIKCQDCHSELYCSKICRDRSRMEHADVCRDRRKQRDERRDRRSHKQVQCDTCTRKFSITKMKKCSSCRTATYCSVDCQKMDWERHKPNCKR